MFYDATELLKLCKELWDSKFKREFKAYIASKICRFDYDTIAEKLNIKRDFVRNYIFEMEKTLNNYGLSIVKIARNVIDGKIDVREACEKLNKNKHLICNGVNHALLMRDIINEIGFSIYFADKLIVNAMLIHAKAFPVFFTLYKNKVKALKHGKRWIVTIPSAIYVYLILARVNHEITFFNAFSMIQVEEIIKKLTRKDIRKLVATREDARNVNSIAKIVIETRYPMVISWSRET